MIWGGQIIFSDVAHATRRGGVLLPVGGVGGGRGPPGKDGPMLEQVIGFVVGWVQQLSVSELGQLLSLSMVIGFAGIALMPWIIGIRGR